MATYNRADLILNAVDSVINQSFRDWELLILDDNSNDNTEDTVRGYSTDQRIKYFKHEQNLGVSRNRNFGLSIAQGKYIAIIDSDDAWIDKNKLKKQYECLENNSEIGLVGTFMIRKYLDAYEDKMAYETEDTKIRKKILLKNQFVHSSVLYRKDFAKGGYNENINLAEDYNLFLRIGTLSKFANIPEYSVKYLVNPNGETSKKKLKMAFIVDDLIVKYKNYYPNYYTARLKSFARIILIFLHIM